MLAPEATRIILSSSIEEAFRNVGNEIVIDSGASGADLTIDAAQADAPQIPESKDSRLRIVLEPLPRRGEDVAQANLRRRAAAMRARAAGAIFVRPASNLRRLGKYPELVEAGALDPEQSKVIADAVRSIIVSRLIPSHANMAILSNEAADYVEAAALVTSSSDLLAKISWESKRLPRTLYVPFKAEIIEAFLDSKIAFFARKSLETVPLGSPIDWRQRLPNASARSALFGLEFLSAVLTFWYQKASGAKSKSVSAVETMLKQRAVTASALLSQVGEIISDFTAHNPPRTPLTAWQGRTVSARARTLVFFLLCCKLATKRRIRFNDAHCAPAFRALLDCLELLRAPEFCAFASVDGVRQDCFLIGAALAFRQISYAEVLLNEIVERLMLQLDLNLSPDGVWNGSFSDHSSVLMLLNGLLDELKVARKLDASGIAAWAQKMARFVEAILKSDGTAPSVVEAAGENYSLVLKSAGLVSGRASRKSSKAENSRVSEWTRSAETYLFRESGYFVSHSSKSAKPESSQLIVSVPRWKDACSSAEILIGLSRNGKDVVVSGQLADDPIPATAVVPPIRNDRGAEPLNVALRMEKVWRGAGWVAVSLTGSIRQGAIVHRTIMHLKAHSAVAVVDEFGGEKRSEIEQIWTLPAELAPVTGSILPLRFRSPQGGLLAISTEARPGASLAQLSCEPLSDESAGPAGWRIRRDTESSRNAMATFFSWEMPGIEAVPQAIFAEPTSWDLLFGENIGLRFARRGAELTAERMSSDASSR